MIHPYRIAPARKPRPKRPTILRLRAVGDRSHALHPLTWRRVVRRLVAITLAYALLAPTMLAVQEGWTAWIRWPIYLVAAVLAWAIVDTLLGLWRLRRARKTIRVWSTRCDHRTGECHTCGGATMTTFPAIAAYRELARTGDVEAFAAKDLRPVTRPLASIVADAEAVMDAARRAQVAAEEASEMLRERAQRGRTG